MMSTTVSENKQLSVTDYLRLITKALLLLLSALFLLLSMQAESQRTWSLTISVEPANSADRARGFILYYINQDESSLTGTWWYENGAVGDETLSPITIKGTKTADGVFWPDVTLQVKNEVTGSWKTLPKPVSVGTRATLTIEPNSRNFDLRVNLDLFKPLIHTHKVGRIILESGQSSEFELKYLVPP